MIIRTEIVNRVLENYQRVGEVTEKIIIIPLLTLFIWNPLYFTFSEEDFNHNSDYPCLTHSSLFRRRIDNHNTNYLENAQKKEEKTKALEKKTKKEYSWSKTRFRTVKAVKVTLWGNLYETCLLNWLCFQNVCVVCICLIHQFFLRITYPIFSIIEVWNPYAK